MRKKSKILAIMLLCVIISLTFLTSCDVIIEAILGLFVPPEPEHDHTWKVITEAGCETKGEEVWDCEKCDEYKSRSIPATGHKFPDKWTVIEEPGCETFGKEERLCENCAKRESRVIHPTGHKFSGEWKVVLEPSCETDGEKERSCAICNMVETLPLPSTGHNIYEDDDHCRDCDKPRLPAPQNVSISGDKISWDRVSNALSYTVTVNGDYTFTTKNRFAYVRDAKNEQGESISTYGEIIVTVRADSVKNYVYSKMSEEAISFYIPTKEDDNNLASLGIGHSYNMLVNDVYSVENISQNSVLDINKLLGLGSYRLSDINNKSTEVYSYSYSSEKYSKAEVKIDFGAEINYGIGNVKASVSGAAEGDMASHKYNHVYVVNGSMIHQQHLISGVNDEETLRQCLSSAFINDLNAVKNGKMTVEQLYAKYGTHVVIGVITGGFYNAQHIVSTDSKAVSEQTAIDFGISTDNKIGSAAELMISFDAKSKEQTSEEWKNTKINLSVSYSGSSGAITLQSANLESSVNDFFAGVKDNAIPFSIPQNGTIPLADVIKSMGDDYYDLANEFADCVTKHCISEFVKEMKRQTSEYYRFDGLFTAKEGGEKIVDENGTILVDISSLNVDTLYPQWTRLKVDVIFNATGGTVDKEYKTVDIGSTYGELPTPTRSGYAFGGWYIGDTPINGNSAVNFGEDHTLVAKWVMVKTTVKDSNRGHLYLDKDETYGEAFYPNFDTEWLLANGYTTFTLEIVIDCKGDGGSFLNARPLIKIYSHQNDLLHQEGFSPVNNNSWDEVKIIKTISIKNDTNKDGSFWIEYGNTGGHTLVIGSVNITITANK